MKHFSFINKRLSSYSAFSAVPIVGKKFEKILIANRGEIAVRVIRTAKKMGIKCVAVFSEADKYSQHVKMADESLLIGPAASSESYLRIENIIDAMKCSGSEAVHPGYGFLSENYKFAESVENLGLTFIGPPSKAIKAMGSKSESKTIMSKAGVPCVPGYHGNNQDPSFLSNIADKIGYPIMIKAVLGGGGKGMRVSRNSDEFIEMLESAKRESKKSFGDDRVILEKYIERSRHIEVQIFADRHGNCVYLFERDCSIQRRNQKIIEEAPAHGLSDELRKKLGETAVKAAKAVEYVGPGTVEFIYDCSNREFYFMEMNTRLQVEHPVTEMITGQDLVEWQIKTASGFSLPMNQENISICGHSIEARIYAEIPENNFMPDTGKLQYFRFPKDSADLRVETGVQENDEISIFYDPMIAKVISRGGDRNEAIQRLDQALSELKVFGVGTNIQFIQKVLGIDKFKQSNIDTNFIKIHKDQLFRTQEPPKNLLIAAALLKLFAQKKFQSGPFDHFRLGSKCVATICLNHAKSKYHLSIIFRDDCIVVAKLPDGSEHSVLVINHENNRFMTLIDKEMLIVDYFLDKDSLSLWTKYKGKFDFEFENADYFNLNSENEGEASGLITSSMPCKINQMMVRVGDSVQVGSPLCITEAMKMELMVKSSVEGVVRCVHFNDGDIVPDKSVLIEIDPSKK